MVLSRYLSNFFAKSCNAFILFANSIITFAYDVHFFPSNYYTSFSYFSQYSFNIAQVCTKSMQAYLIFIPYSLLAPKLFDFSLFTLRPLTFHCIFLLLFVKPFSILVICNTLTIFPLHNHTPLALQTLFLFFPFALIYICQNKYCPLYPCPFYTQTEFY